MKKRIVKNLIAVVFVFMALCSVAQKAQKVVPAEDENFKQFYGTWNGNMIVVEGDRSDTLSIQLECTKAAEGYGFYLVQTVEDSHGGKSKSATLAGYDPGDSLVYWFAVDDNSATVYKGTWVTSKQLAVQYDTKRHGERMIEKITMTFKGKDEFELKVFGKLGDKDLDKITGILYRKPEKPRK